MVLRTSRRGIDRRGRDLVALSRLGNQPPEEVDAGDEREEGQDDEDNEEALNAVFFLNASLRTSLLLSFSKSRQNQTKNLQRKSKMKLGASNEMAMIANMQSRSSNKIAKKMYIRQ